VVRHTFHRANRCLTGLLGSQHYDLGSEVIPSHRVLRIGGGLSPMGNLKADDAIHDMYVEQCIDRTK